MKYARLSSRIYGRPLLIAETEYYNISNTFQSIIKHGFDKRAFMDGDSSSGISTSPYVTVGKVAIVTLAGPIVKHADIIDTMCGMTDVDSFLSNVQAAFVDTNVETIILDINSPGGEVTGVKEAADAIRLMAETKDIIAFTDDICASAAYWIASACNLIFTTETSAIGSIGVFMGLYDQSAAFAMEGIKPVLIKAGASKADGFPGLPISDDTIARLQDEVNQINDMFRSAIALKRDLDDSTMQGQCFMGINAEAVNLSDGTVDNLNQLVNFVNAELTKNQ